MNHLYGMRLRGYSPGCQPKEGLVERRDSPIRRYYDVLVYDHQLTEKEELSYELDYIGAEFEHELHAAKGSESQ